MALNMQKTDSVFSGLARQATQFPMAKPYAAEVAYKDDNGVPLQGLYPSGTLS